MNGGPVFEFAWDPAKAASNERKHGVSFELAASAFFDPHVATVFDCTHSEQEERWFSIGQNHSGNLLTVVHTWTEIGRSVVAVRIIFGPQSH